MAGHMAGGDVLKGARFQGRATADYRSACSGQLLIVEDAERLQARPEMDNEWAVIIAYDDSTGCTITSGARRSSIVVGRRRTAAFCRSGPARRWVRYQGRCGLRPTLPLLVVSGLSPNKTSSPTNVTDQSSILRSSGRQLGSGRLGDTRSDALGGVPAADVSTSTRRRDVGASSFGIRHSGEASSSAERAGGDD